MKHCDDNDPRRFLEGKRFGRLTVIRCVSLKDKILGYCPLYWECKCDCGKTKIVRGSNLVKGLVKSCGCYGKELLKNHVLDLTGKTFGKLKVLRRLSNNSFQLSIWECQCTCGNISSYVGTRLNRGDVTCCDACRKISHGGKRLKKDLCGVHFGDWTVIKRAENKVLPSGTSRVCWECEDSKGNRKTVFATYIMTELKNNSKKGESNE